jgi:hypothetical protein
MAGERAKSPLGGILMEWAGVKAPELKTSAPLDLQQLMAASGRMVFLVNWGTAPAKFELTLEALPGTVREITTGREMPKSQRIQDEVPPQGVRVYRVEN